MKTQIKIGIVLLSISFTSVGHSSAINQCSNLFLEKPQTLNEFATKVRNFRKTRIYKDGITKAVVNGIKYKIKGVLGEGTSTVYLATAPDGQMVTIKMIDDYSSWINSLYYEIAITRFYLQMGERVPSIHEYEIKFDSEKDTHVALLVKEYREGITREELEELLATKPRKWHEGEALLRELEQERKKMLRVHKKFAAWLNANKINLQQYPFKQLESLIKKGDMADNTDNFLYDIELNKWIIFDP
jgi:hypothetical protein